MSSQPINLFSSASSSSAIFNRDSQETVKNMKSNFREDIRKAKTRQILNSKRVRQFHDETTNTTEYSLQEIQAKTTDFINTLAEASRLSSLDAISATVKSIKDLSHQQKCQEHFIVAGLHTILIRFLEFEVLHADVCWILSNLICHSSFEIPQDICEHLILCLVQLVSSPKVETINSAYWCLSNLAGDEKFSNAILNSNICASMHSLIVSETTNKDVIYQMTYTIKNITQNLQSNSQLQQVLRLIDVMNLFFRINGEQILGNLIESATNLIRFFVLSSSDSQSSCASTFCQLFDYILNISNMNTTLYDQLLDFSAQFVSLKTDSTQQDTFLAYIKPILKASFSSLDALTRRKACLIISNLLPQLHNVSSLAPLLSDLIQLLSTESSFENKAIILRGILHALSSVTNPQLLFTMFNNNLIESLAVILKEEKNEAILLPSLDVLKRIMLLNRESTSTSQPQQNSSVIQCIETVGLVQILQNLQDHPSDNVYECTSDIISEFFDFEEYEQCDTEDY